MTIPLRIRPECPGDRPAVFEVNELAFGRPNEAELVDTLRDTVEPFLSFVAVDDGGVIGNVCYSPVTIDAGDRRCRVLGLAPMAVRPERQNGSVGSQLGVASLDACRAAGHQAVVVLGPERFYPRFGFRPASEFGVQCPYDVPDEVFMLLELVSGAMDGWAGVARYHPAFASCDG